jgi:hypothetical protein
MSQKVKIQVSSDLEDVSLLSSALLGEALLHITKLRNTVDQCRALLEEVSLENEQDLEKLRFALESLSSTRLAVNKTDNRLADVVAILDGFYRVLTTKPEELQKENIQEQVTNENVSVG